MPSAMPPNVRAGSAQPDDLDRLLDDDDNAVDDFFNNLPREVQNSNSRAAQNEQAKDEDQEVQVKKQRIPIPKLDENRLLSEAGIPRLRKITKSRLKFRGKGHEYSDISNLLNTYQLWLDDLYPRAKFRDAVTMVEKVGHSKRMQVTRRAWLDDTKPHRRELTPPPDLDMSHLAGRREADKEDTTSGDTGLASAPHATTSQADVDAAAPGDEELDVDGNAPTNRSMAFRRPEPLDGDDGPDEDELDALMANAEVTGPTIARVPRKRKSQLPFEEESDSDDDDDDDDELEAWMAAQPPNQPHPSATSRRGEDDFADDEEAMRETW